MSKVYAKSRAVILAALAVAPMTSALRAELAPEALKQAQANFKTANVSNTGQLTPAEFKTFIDLNAAAQIGRAPKIKANNAYDRAFSKVDANKDGKVSWDEYLKAQSSP
jgi:spermidine/putrescine-binding protein